MTSQELVVEALKRRMRRAFASGNLALATHLESWVSTMESMEATPVVAHAA